MNHWKILINSSFQTRQIFPKMQRCILLFRNQTMVLVWFGLLVLIAQGHDGRRHHCTHPVGSMMQMWVCFHCTQQASLWCHVKWALFPWVCLGWWLIKVSTLPEHKATRGDVVVVCCTVPSEIQQHEGDFDPLGFPMTACLAELELIHQPPSGGEGVHPGLSPCTVSKRGNHHHRVCEQELNNQYTEFNPTSKCRINSLIWERLAHVNLSLHLIYKGNYSESSLRNTR